MNATWPFATLTVTRDLLQLNATILGNLKFIPQDIISIEPYSTLPLFGKGIRINHRVGRYYKKVIFWTTEKPEEVIQQIRRTGFLDNNNAPLAEEDRIKIIEERKAGGFPIKIPVALAVVAAWNVLLITDVLRSLSSGNRGLALGYGSIIALAMIFLLSLLTLVSEKFSALILRKGRTRKEMKNFLIFLMFVAGFMLFSVLTM